MKDLDSCDNEHPGTGEPCGGPAVQWVCGPESGGVISSCDGCRVSVSSWTELSRSDAEVYSVMLS